MKKTIFAVMFAIIATTAFGQVERRNDSPLMLINSFETGKIVTGLWLWNKKPLCALSTEERAELDTINSEEFLATKGWEKQPGNSESPVFQKTLLDGRIYEIEVGTISIISRYTKLTDRMSEHHFIAYCE